MGPATSVLGMLHCNLFCCDRQKVPAVAKENSNP